MATPLLSDLRNAARSLRRSPAVTISAVLCLTLGIGATAAISSAVSRALLQPLPFAHPDRLVAVHRVTPQSGPMGTWPQSVPNYLDLARETRQLQGLAALTWGTALVQTSDGAIKASQMLVTGNLFPLLGAPAGHGRLIGPADDKLDAPAVAVLSDEFWRSKLGGDPGVVGRTMNIDGQPTTIVGITPPDFRIPHGSNVLHADVWSPIRFQPHQLTQRRSNFLLLLGRLAPSASVASAHAEIRGLFAGLVTAYPQLRGEDVRVAQLQSDSARAIRTPLLLLLGAVGLVLLVAATNVAALLLARAVQRRREMAIRSALGANRMDAMRPALSESLLISIFGTAGGLLVALAGVRTIGAVAAARMPQLAGLSVDTRVIGLSIALALVVALVCGAVPAWRGATVDPQQALGDGRGGGMGRQQHRALRGLVLLEIALSLVLLIGAGLVLKAFTQLARNDPGFETAHVLTMQVTVPAADYKDGEAIKRMLRPSLAAIRALPGVESVGSISNIPFVNWGNNSNIRYEGQPPADPTTFPLVEQRAIDPGFFSVTGQRLLAGRLLNESDDDRPEAPQVVVVNQALVQRDFKGEDPIGKRFYTGDTTFGTIVGVVSDIRNVGPFAPPAPEMYSTYLQGWSGTTSFPLMVRVRGGDPAVVTGELRGALRHVTPAAALSDVRTMPEVIARSLGQPRFYASMMGSFAVLALVLAVAGLYGVLGYVVAQRTREIGIRAALGSSREALVRLMALEGARLVFGGLVLGTLGGALVTRLMVFMLYGVSALDPWTWLTAALVLVLAAMVAILVPARRAAHVDPLVAIRAE